MPFSKKVDLSLRYHNTIKKIQRLARQEIKIIKNKKKMEIYFKKFCIVS